MSDPIHDLENFNRGGVPVNPLSPSEVRRLGDRMRRRRNAGVALASVVAVAAIATPFAIAAGGNDPQDLAPAPEPTVTETTTAPRTSIPDDFPLFTGPGTDVVTTEPTLAEKLTYCGDVALAGAEPVDTITGLVSGGESYTERSLLLFGSESEAAQAEATLLESAAVCTLDESNDVAVANRVLPASADWPGRTIEEQAAPDRTDSTYMYVNTARAGSALLLTKVYLDVTGRDALPSAWADLGPVLDAMEVFGPVESGSGATEAPADTISSDFPIDVDLEVDPEGSKEGPAERADGVEEISPCDQAAWPVTHADRLAVFASGPMTWESRELVLLGSPAEARAALAGIRSAVAGCPTEIKEDDPTDTPEVAWRTHPAALGEVDSVTLSVTFTDGGTGATFWQLTRVGSAILAVGVGGEYSSDSTDYAVTNLSAVTGQLTPEMCVFTAAGC